MLWTILLPLVAVQTADEPLPIRTGVCAEGPADDIIHVSVMRPDRVFRIHPDTEAIITDGERYSFRRRSPVGHFFRERLCHAAQAQALPPEDRLAARIVIHAESNPGSALAIEYPLFDAPGRMLRAEVEEVEMLVPTSGVRYLLDHVGLDPEQ
ncbi:hypothetical protein [Sphingosinithalassobacter sp. CS137]|uniref:hypothetical protein n=1 Tax=Sphingosinithalassobacter sp. CS137 TaxID=2762748 RepID=UPI00165E6402|nr:hypothetical protein [Sphingosinithalassobacter sp. CS137]